MSKLLSYLVVILIGVGCALLIRVLLKLYQKKQKHKENLEQMTRKAKEDALDRAISNQRHTQKHAEAQRPDDIHYNADETVSQNTAMIKLTELGETVSRTYLFNVGDAVYIGEEHGKPAVFAQNDETHKISVHIFTQNGALCVRGLEKDSGMLVRGKNRVTIGKQGLKLKTNDIIETRHGSFQIEVV